MLANNVLELFGRNNQASSNAWLFQGLFFFYESRGFTTCSSWMGKLRLPQVGMGCAWDPSGCCQLQLVLPGAGIPCVSPGRFLAFPSTDGMLLPVLCPLCPGVCSVHAPVRLPRDPEDPGALSSRADPAHPGGAPPAHGAAGAGQCGRGWGWPQVTAGCWDSSCRALREHHRHSRLEKERG